MADKYRRRIAVTHECALPDEPERIARLLDSGRFSDVHLRHPGASRREMLHLIEDIPQRLHGRLHLHGHFDLTNEFNLGGIHLNRRCPTPPDGYGGTLSASCHSIEEVARCRAAGLSYVTLSPVFDSLSKSGYRAAFTADGLSRLDGIDQIEIVALGGVTPENIGQLDRYNFAGYAMLTAAWI